MTPAIEYQIFIGCNDSQLNKELVAIENMIEVISIFFEREKIDFTLFRATGGYYHENGWYITENSLCINIINPSNIDIFKLTKSISMIMNQERALIIKNVIEKKFK